MADRDRGPVVRMADLGPAAGVAAKRPVACGVVSGGNRTKLERRVVRAAEAALAERKFVTAIDVLVGVGWLQPAKVAEWRQGRVDYLERAVIASLGRISTAMRCFRAWARARGPEAERDGVCCAHPRPAAAAVLQDRRSRDRAGIPNALGLARAVRPQAGAAGRAPEPSAAAGGDLAGERLHVLGMRVAQRGPVDDGRRRARLSRLRRRGPSCVPGVRRRGADPTGEGEQSAFCGGGAVQPGA
jgi:hypothetical protein